ncbi:hypothetical protein ACTA71_001403 [Dictyostelium dimigraforme]
MEKIQKITDLVSAYQKVSSYKKVEKKLNNGKSYKIKKLFLIRGRYYYPAKVHRKGPSNVTLIKNTAMNTFQTVEEATDEAIYNRMYAAKQREKMIKASALVQSIMSMAGNSYQKALQQHGLTSSDGLFQYNEDDDNEDYEPSESDGEGEEEDNSDTEDEEEQQLKQLKAKDEDEEFEEQEIDEDEEEVDEDEEYGEDEGFEMENDFDDSE